MIKKILFWIFVIAVGFVNPIFSGILVVCYYLPKILQDYFNSQSQSDTQKMKSYSDDVLEDMR